MATATRPHEQLTGDGEAITYELIDGVPVGRPVDELGGDAYAEAFEVVDGKILEWPEMGTFPTEIAGIIHEFLAAFVRRERLGRSLVETQFQITPTKQRRPDVAFVPFSKWPKTRRTPNGIWNMIPDLAVEVVSQTDKAWEMMEKLREYFDAGVAAVWLVYPNLELVHVYSSFEQIEVVTRAGTLDGGAIVPGFRLPLVELFEETDPEPPAGVDDEPA